MFLYSHLFSDFYLAYSVYLPTYLRIHSFFVLPRIVGSVNDSIGSSTVKREPAWPPRFHGFSICSNRGPWRPPRGKLPRRRPLASLRSSASFEPTSTCACLCLLNLPVGSLWSPLTGFSAACCVLPPSFSLSILELKPPSFKRPCADTATASTASFSILFWILLSLFLLFFFFFVHTLFIDASVALPSV